MPLVGQDAVISCGTGTTMVLSNEGELWNSGLNYKLQLGFENPPPHCRKQHCWKCIKSLSREYFQLMHTAENYHIPRFKTVYTCGSTSFAVTAHNRLFSWGNNQCGQLGQGDAEQAALPTAVKLCNASVSPYASPLRADVESMPAVRQVACGNQHAVVLTMEGVVYTCGDNSRGQLGVCDFPLSGTSNRFVRVYPATPACVVAGKQVLSIASGAFACAMIQADHRLWMWGCNINSQIVGAQQQAGGRLVVAQKTPVVASLGNEDNHAGSRHGVFSVQSVSLGCDHCACITTDHGVWTWGMNSYGKLGNGTKNGGSRPTCVICPKWLLSIPLQVCCGGFHTLIRTDTGALWAAGNYKLGLGIDGGHSSFAAHFQSVRMPHDTRANAATTAGKKKKAVAYCAMRVVAMAAGKTHSAIVCSGNAVLTCGKMKTLIPGPLKGPPTGPRGVDAEEEQQTETNVCMYNGFSGLGYFQGLARHGHVSLFRQVYQLKDVVAFYDSFSTSSLAKISAYLVGVHFDTQPRPGKTRDRAYMSLLPDEVIDLIVAQLRVSPRPPPLCPSAS